MALKEEFDKAVVEVTQLKNRPGNAELLSLYSLFKQATEGDVIGSRPGMLDIKGRAKFDAWAKLKGKSGESAMQEYVKLVQELKSKD